MSTVRVVPSAILHMNAGGGAKHMCIIGSKLHSVRQAARRENQARNIDIGIDRTPNISLSSSEATSVRVVPL